MNENSNSDFEFMKKTLPYWVKPNNVELISVEGLKYGVKIQCFLPITLLKRLKETLYFNINDQKAYLGDTLNADNNVVNATFVLTELLPFEKANYFNNNTKIRIERWKE